MILVSLIIIPLAGGLLAWLAGRGNERRPRWVALAALTLDVIPALILLGRRPASLPITPAGPWLLQFKQAWIPQLGVSFELGVDGLSLTLVLLTLFLGIMAIGAAWTEIRERTGFFYFNLMWVLSGILGVFMALDLFLFYFFWELMLVPMYLIIAIWGHANRVYAAVKFFLFTQISGLLMLVAILALYFIHGRATGIYTFDYLQLLGTPLSPTAGRWLLLGFFVAFAVKLPALPVHTWLPDAHTEAPTPGSVILAGLLLKTGAYGLLRFVLPLFPESAAAFAPYAMVLAVAAILYGALLAFAQSDLKRLVAYTSVSHMGFVLLGASVANQLALQGVVLTIICHGVSTGALFILVGALQERIHTRQIEEMGGLWPTVPRLGAMLLVFSLASLGLPGLGNFVGEFLVLIGSFRVDPALAVLATLGLVTASVYALRIVQRVLHGSDPQGRRLVDLGKREMAVMGALGAAILWLGLYPQPLFKATSASLTHLQQSLTNPGAPSLQALNRGGFGEFDSKAAARKEKSP